jgi:type VI secretion system protein ImpK
MTSSATSAAPVRSDNLALLYQGVLTGIVRLQSGRQPLTDVAAFQKRMKNVFADIAREAMRLGYTQQDVFHTSCAVVAFLDEAVLSSKDPRAAEWVRLQSGGNQQAMAGDSFFDQIGVFWKSPDSPQLADILEVYYLCLLLGFRGRYAGRGEAELQQIMARLKSRIDAIRGRRGRLSPSAVPAGRMPDAPPAATPDTARILGRAALGAAAMMVTGWIVCRLLLFHQAAELQTALEHILVP